MNIREQARKLKEDSTKMAILSEDVRNKALRAVAIALEKNKNKILQANEQDLQAAEADNVPMPVLKRLKFDWIAGPTLSDSVIQRVGQRVTVIQRDVSNWCHRCHI